MDHKNLAYIQQAKRLKPANKADPVSCRLWSEPQKLGLYMNGDFVIGGLFSIHYNLRSEQNTYSRPPLQPQCSGSMDFRQLRFVRAMEFTIHEINNRTDLLPGITLGYQIHDSCAAVPMTVKIAFQFANGMEPFYNDTDSCSKPAAAAVPAVVGESNSPPSISMTRILGLFGIPQVSYYATCACLSDKRQTDPRSKLERLANIIRRSTARVIVAFLASGEARVLLEELTKQPPQIQWIGSDAWITHPEFLRFNMCAGAIGFGVPRSVIPGLREFLLDLSPAQALKSPLLTEFWESSFSCSLKGSSGGARECNGSEDIRALQNPYTDTSQLRITNLVYKATYAIAHAIHGVICNDTQCDKSAKFAPWQILDQLKRVNFTTKNGYQVSFDSNGDPVAVYELINWQTKKDGGFDVVTVGYYYSFKPRGQEFRMSRAIRWMGGQTEVPKSVCSESCPPGTRKAVQKGKPLCCYDCIPCAEGEISNRTDSLNCVKCPSELWPNTQHDNCLPKPVEFLSWDDTLSIILTAFSIIGAFIAQRLSVLTFTLIQPEQQGRPPLATTIHSRRICHATKIVHEVKECNGVFLGTIAVDGEPWMVDIDIKDRRLPFGIASAPEHFQNRMATEVTGGLKGIVCHMDDVLVRGKNQEKCDTHLNAVKNSWVWGTGQANAFQTLKEVLSSPPVLTMYDPNRDCKVMNFRELRYARAMEFAIHEINNRTDLLPGITLGYQIHDSCSEVPMAVKVAFQFANGMEPFYNDTDSCSKSAAAAVPALVGDSVSTSSVSMTRMLGLFGIPQVSHYATCACLSDKRQTDPRSKLERVANVIRRSTARVIVAFVHSDDMKFLLEELARQPPPPLQWIGSDAWITHPEFLRFNMCAGAIGFAIPLSEIPGLREFLLDLSPAQALKSPLLTEFWESSFSCSLKGSSEGARECDASEDIRALQNPYTDTSQLRATNLAYKATYAIAHAIHGVICNDTQCDKSAKFTPWQILHELKRVNFITKNGFQVSFDSSGDPVAVYELVNWQVKKDGGIDFVTVGQYDSSRPGGQEFTMSRAITWMMGQTEVPRSVCSESCPPGTWKAVQKGKPVCCYDCIPCAEGEISNKTDSLNCVRCPSEFWPSAQHNNCLPKPVEFLSWDDTLSIILTVFSITGAFIAQRLSVLVFTLIQELPACQRYIHVLLLGTVDVIRGLSNNTPLNCLHFLYEAMRVLRFARAMEFTIHEINNRTDLLPGITLGYQIHDTCAAVPMATKVSHYSTCTCLSDKREYPAFLRTVPSDHHQAAALARMVKHFGWTWIGAVRSDSDYGNYGMASFLKAAQEEGICVEYSESYYRTDPRSKLERVANVIRRSTARVIVAFLASGDMRFLLEELARQPPPPLQWIASETWITDPEFLRFNMCAGAIGFGVPRSVIPGLREFLLDLSPAQALKSPLLTEFWESSFSCSLKGSSGGARKCNGSEDIRALQNPYTDTSQLRITNLVYKATYAIAHAIHGVICNDTQCDKSAKFAPWQILSQIKRVNFTTNNGFQVIFDSNGDPVAVYELINWQFKKDGTLDFITVGHYDSSRPRGQEFSMSRAISWMRGQTEGRGGVLEPIPAVIGRKAGYTLDRSPVPKSKERSATRQTL
ncbi:hypothetical protein MHYP_G00128470 [Metynnis hypsauchen]